MRKEINLVYVYDTKGAVRYAEILSNGKPAQQPNDPGTTIGVLYIRKSALNGDKIPSRIKLTIESVNG